MVFKQRWYNSLSFIYRAISTNNPIKKISTDNDDIIDDNSNYNFDEDGNDNDNDNGEQIIEMLLFFCPLLSINLCNHVNFYLIHGSK